MRLNIVLLVLAVILAIPVYLTLSGSGTAVQRIAEIPRLFDGFSPDSLHSLAIRRPVPNSAPAAGSEPQFESLELRREVGGWVLSGENPLAGAPVRTLDVENNILDHLERIRRDDEVLVATEASDEVLERYGLDEASATYVGARAPDGVIVAELYVGKRPDTVREGDATTPAVQGRYVRRLGKREIVLYETPEWNLSVRSEAWVDRTVHDVPLDSIASITIKNPKFQGAVGFRVKPGSDGVLEVTGLPDGFDAGAVRQVEVRSLFQRFARVIAKDFAGRVDESKPAVTGLDGSFVVKATLKDGSILDLEFGHVVPNAPSLAFGKTDRNPFLIHVPDHLRAVFMRDLSSWFDPPASAVGNPDKDGD